MSWGRRWGSYPYSDLTVGVREVDLYSLFNELIFRTMPVAAVRRVLFENDDDQYTYHGIGSCFIFALNGRLFMATAKHVMTANQSSAEYLFIMSSDNSLKCLPFTSMLNWNSGDVNNNDGSDANDAVVFIVGDTSNAKMQIDYARLHVRNIANRFELVNYICVGCPGDLNPIDYDVGKIMTYKSRLMGRFSKQDECVVTLILQPGGGIPPINGMSGGACFCYSDEKPFDIKFAGIIIQGNAVSRTIRFLKAEIITKLAAEEPIMIRGGEIV